MVFSWTVGINGDIGNIRYSWNVPGLGLSGRCPAQLEFDIFDPPDSLIDDLAAPDFVITPECPELATESQPFWVDSRSVSNYVCHVVCYDRLSRADAPYINNHNWQAGEKRSAHNVLLDICGICGFDSYGTSSSFSGLNFISFTQSDLTDKSCGELLDLMSETAAGVWACLDNNLYLVCFGSVAGGNISAQEHAGIEYQGKTAVIGLVAKNSSTGKTYTYGTTTGNGVVVQIENGLVNENTAGGVWTRISDYEYTAWNCEKADITTQHFNFCGPMILNMDKSYHPRSVDLSVDSTGIYFSGGCPAYDDWNYRSKLEREKIGIGKTVGNTSVAESGRINFINLN